MIDSKVFQRVFDIEDNAERCKRGLIEVHPVVKNLLDKFLSLYGDKDSLIIDCSIFSYDGTLRNSLRSNYGEKNKDTSIGKKYYMRFEKKLKNDVSVTVFFVEFNGTTKNIKIGIECDFFYLMEAVRLEKLKPILNSLDKDIKAIIYESDGLKEIELSNFNDKIKDLYNNSNKTPNSFIGIMIPFEGEFEDTYLIEQFWSTWNKVKVIRDYFLENAKKQELTMNIINTLSMHDEDSEIRLFGSTYTLRFDDIDTTKFRKHKQKFYINKGGQSVTDGFFLFHKYNSYGPHEKLELCVNQELMISTSLRPLVDGEKFEWWIKKNFAKHNVKYNNVQRTGEAMKCLKDHGIASKENSYFIGTYNNETKGFEEPVENIKQRLVTAAVIFADVGDTINLPKYEAAEETDISSSEAEEEATRKYNCNFDLTEIINIIEESSFTFSKEIIRDFHLNLTSLSSKHFVILNGISGTGKTQLCRLYTNAVYGLSYDEDNPYLKIIPVRPDWMEATALFGYYSSIEKCYKKTEFLDIVLNALNEMDKPHFVVMDEMNLARVEYYLSDYLSAVESRKPIRLHNEENVAEIPGEITIPPNLYLIGTVNIDETTYSISDKVLDRAFVMTLSDVNFSSYWEGKDETLKKTLEKEFNLLLELHSMLAPYDLHFGYRSMEEMLSKLIANKKLPEDIRMSEVEALDRVICEKILPKVRGDEHIKAIMDNLQSWTDSNLEAGSETGKHIKRMKKELERYGATQFWR